MENYEKKYKEALCWIRKIYPTMNSCDKEDAERHFPELKESEDERIRKEIINYIKHSNVLVEQSVFISWITWLEKQGEQKPAWSEEDNKRLQRIIDFLWHNRKGDTDTIYQQEQDIEWLKSFKNRHIWKPSDEQIKAIRLARSFVTDDFADNPALSEILMDLEEQLKKLKEE